MSDWKSRAKPVAAAPATSSWRERARAVEAPAEEEAAPPEVPELLQKDDEVERLLEERRALEKRAPDALGTGALTAADTLSMGFGDELQGAKTAANGALARVLTGHPREALSHLKGDYTAARDTVRTAMHEGEQVHPTAATAGRVAGFVGSLALPGAALKAATGAGLLARAGAGAGTGFAMGGLAGLGADEGADLTRGDWDKVGDAVALPAVIGGGVGALAGAAAPLIEKGADRASRYVGGKADALKKALFNEHVADYSDEVRAASQKQTQEMGRKVGEGLDARAKWKAEAGAAEEENALALRRTRDAHTDDMHARLNDHAQESERVAEENRRAVIRARAEYERGLREARAAARAKRAGEQGRADESAAKKLISGAEKQRGALKAHEDALVSTLRKELVRLERAGDTSGRIQKLEEEIAGIEQSAQPRAAQAKAAYTGTVRNHASDALLMAPESLPDEVQPFVSEVGGFAARKTAEHAAEAGGNFAGKADEVYNSSLWKDAMQSLGLQAERDALKALPPVDRNALIQDLVKRAQGGEFTNGDAFADALRQALRKAGVTRDPASVAVPSLEEALGVARQGPRLPPAKVQAGDARLPAFKPAPELRVPEKVDLPKLRPVPQEPDVGLLPYDSEGSISHQMALRGEPVDEYELARRTYGLFQDSAPVPLWGDDVAKQAFGEGRTLALRDMPASERAGLNAFRPAELPPLKLPELRPAQRLDLQLGQARASAGNPLVDLAKGALTAGRAVASGNPVAMAGAAAQAAGSAGGNLATKAVALERFQRALQLSPASVAKWGRVLESGGISAATMHALLAKDPALRAAYEQAGQDEGAAP